MSAPQIPGPKSRSLAERLRAVESRNVTYLSERFPIFWKSAQGSWVEDVDGNRFLDLTSAFGVAGLGHTPPALQKAIERQIQKLWHGMGDVHPSEVKVLLLEALARIAPGDLNVSILSSSGAEAVESAIKTARLATGKPGVICFDGGYHGLTYGTLSLTDRSESASPFSDQISDYAITTAFPNALRGPREEEVLGRVESLLKGNNWPGGHPIGAVILEPMQGRGGVQIPKPHFLTELRTLTKRHDALLIVDEVFTGFGRTGKRFAVEHSHVVPDLLCVGKALANGFPLSACVGTDTVMKAWPLSDGEAIHTSTFLGNPLGCAMALAALEESDHLQLAERAARIGAAWIAQLKEAVGDFEPVAEIRGSGFMIGIELVTDRQSKEPNPVLSSRVIQAGLQKGLLLLSGGKRRNVLTLTPPLTIAEDELSLAAKTLKEILNDLA